MKSKIFKFIILTLFSVAATHGYAQKVSFAFLKGTEKLHVVFDYSDLKIQGQPEKSYVASQGEEWAGQWETAKANTYGAKFIEYFNKSCNKVESGNYPDAPYQATVRALTLSKIWALECEIVFTKKGDPAPVAKVKIKGDSRTAGIAAGAPSFLTARAFSYAGQNLGKIIAIQLK